MRFSNVKSWFMKPLFSIVTVVLLGTAFAQESPTVSIKGHVIGETTQQFFAIATMGDTGGQRTVEYCNNYMNDPKRMKAYDKAQSNIFDFKANRQSANVGGCLKVRSALDGKDVKLDVQYASELDAGDVTFHADRLVILNLILRKASYDDVVVDMNKKVGVQPQFGEDISQNAFGAKLAERKATWSRDTLLVQVREIKDLRWGDMGVSVIVADQAFLRTTQQQREASRPNTLD
jgi:hypothetical protein